jgi:hypothetical protein
VLARIALLLPRGQHPKRKSAARGRLGDKGEAALAVLTPVVLVVWGDCERGMRVVSQSSPRTALPKLGTGRASTGCSALLGFVLSATVDGPDRTVPGAYLADGSTVLSKPVQIGSDRRFGGPSNTLGSALADDRCSSSASRAAAA